MKISKMNACTDVVVMTCADEVWIICYNAAKEVCEDGSDFQCVIHSQKGFLTLVTKHLTKITACCFMAVFWISEQTGMHFHNIKQSQRAPFFRSCSSDFLQIDLELVKSEYVEFRASQGYGIVLWGDTSWLLMWINLAVESSFEQMEIYSQNQ